MGGASRALVTGAAGFVGANLVRRLVEAGHDVVAVTRPGGTAWRLEDLSTTARLLELDLRDRTAVERAIADARPDWIFHLAAHGAYSWQGDFETMVAVNVSATEALLAAARAGGVSAFVHAGSSSEYGRKEHAPREDEWLLPNSYYATTKAAATHLTALAASEGLPALTLRLYSIYGPWEDPRRLVPAIVREAAHDRLPPLVGPETARDFVYVDDCCDALLAAARLGAPDVPGAVLNIGSGHQTRLDELVEVARGALGIEASPNWGTMPQREWDTNRWVSDPRTALAVLGWQATTSLADGLLATSRWLQDRRDLWPRYGLIE